MSADTLYVNLFAGSGAGKSTSAAGSFAICKLVGVNSEIITEYAKDVTWEGTQVLLANQISVFGQQYHRTYRLNGKVDVAITDSPIPLGCIYNTNPYLEALIMDTFQSYNNLNYYINRVKPFNPKGRNQTEAEARALDLKGLELLAKYGIPYTVIDGDENAMTTIAADIYKRLTGDTLIAKLTIEIIKNNGGN